jgi:predicted Fe-Mo cluster-binding NifX family protein
MEYKIAAASEDSKTISSHFGMAPVYRVYTIADGQVVAVDERPKPHHARHPDHDAGGHPPHGDMFAPVTDCRVLLCGGMGAPAYQKALAAGLEVVLAGGEIQATVNAYLEGKLVSDLRRVHQH